VKPLKHLVGLSLTSLACATASTLSSAQAVYRCGNSYSQTPCAHGVIVQTDDARSEAQRAAAQQVVSEQKTLATEMETARKKDEALAFQREQTARAAQTRLAGAKTREEAKKTRDAKPHKKPAGLRTVKVQEDGVFTSTSGTPKTKKTQSHSSAP
jgi:hypothetical protein